MLLNYPCASFCENHNNFNLFSLKLSKADLIKFLILTNHALMIHLDMVYQPDFV